MWPTRSTPRSTRHCATAIVGERLNEGDDDTYDETHLARFGGDITITLSHRDQRSGRRTPGPSPTAQARAHATAATTRTTPAHSDNTDKTDNNTNTDVAADSPPRYPGGRRWHLTDRATDQQARPAPWRMRPDGPPPF